MPISDEEAYKQGKRIAEDMMRGSYSPSKDYSDRRYGRSGSRKKTLWIVVTIVAAIILLMMLFK